MAERAIFLDRDNTIIENDGYLGDPSKVKLLPGAATAIAAMRRMDYRIIVVSNQSGVARGLFDEAAVEAVNQEMCRQLREKAGAHVDASYYCPYHPEAVIAEYRQAHHWRKPQPGMLRQAAEDFRLDLAQCWMIGDQPRDIAAGAAVSCRTILLRDPEHPAPDANPPDENATANFIVKSLADAARIIVREGPRPLRTAPASSTSTSTTAAPAPPSPSLPAEPLAAAAPTLASSPMQITEHQQRPAQDAIALSSHAENLRPLLEEIAALLRQSARLEQRPQEFTLPRMLATILQVGVALCLVMGAWDALATAPTYNQCVLSLLTALAWFLGGVALQATVIALLLFDRKN